MMPPGPKNLPELDAKEPLRLLTPPSPDKFPLPILLTVTLTVPKEPIRTILAEEETTCWIGATALPVMAIICACAVLFPSGLPSSKLNVIFCELVPLVVGTR